MGSPAQEARAGDLLSVAEVVGPNGPLGAIWQVAGREGLERLIPEDVATAPRGRSGGGGED